MTEPYRISGEEFDELVRVAWDEVPPVFRGRLDHVVVRTALRPEPGQPRDLLGLYEGWPEPAHPGIGVDVITLYKETHERHVSTLLEMREQIRETLLHEIGHHFGMSEDDLERVTYGVDELEAAEEEVADGWAHRDRAAILLLLTFPPLGLILALEGRQWSRREAILAAGMCVAMAVVAAVAWNPAWLLGLVMPGPSLLIGAPGAAYLAWLSRTETDGRPPDDAG